MNNYSFPEDSSLAPHWRVHADSCILLLLQVLSAGCFVSRSMTQSKFWYQIYKALMRLCMFRTRTQRSSFQYTVRAKSLIKEKSRRNVISFTCTGGWYSHKLLSTGSVDKPLPVVVSSSDTQPKRERCFRIGSIFACMLLCYCSVSVGAVNDSSHLIRVLPSVHTSLRSRDDDQRQRGAHS